MNRLAFFDTNVLVYADDTSEPQRQAVAVALISSYRRADRLVLSLQVLQEYFVTVTKKLGVDPAVAQQKVELFSRARIVRFTEDDVIASIELHRLSRISFWDAMIVRAAKVCGAEVLFSEDLQHGASMTGVRVENPFLAT